MIPTCLKRETFPEKFNPSLRDVLEVMDQILIDDFEPSLEIQSEQLHSSLQIVISQLLIARLNDTISEGSGDWLVSHFIKGASDAEVLISQRLSGDVYHNYELFGGIYEIRTACLVDQKTITEAVQWYLEFGNLNPNLTWIPYDEGVRPT